MTDKKSAPTVGIIGVPSDLGANIRGANIGPSAIRIAGLNQKLAALDYKVHDRGDINIPVRESLPTSVQQTQFLPAIEAVCRSVSDSCVDALTNGEFPLIIGGDHSVVIGSFSGVQKFYKKQNKNIGLIWIDAHADINTIESSPSGNIHGMPVAILLGKGHQNLVDLDNKGAKIRPEQVAMIGIRNIDGKEKEELRKSGIRYFTMREIDERGMFAIMKEAIAVAGDATDGIHLSFDIDAIDPLYAPGVSTPEPGGLSFREAHLALEMLADTKKLVSADFVELNPSTDVGHKTADLTVGLILSALGKSIV